MTGLRERKKLDAWERIRSAAMALFAERGFDGVTVDEIASAAGVSRATFFSYFRSKEAVVFDHHPRDRDAWLASMAARPLGESLWDGLSAVLIEFNERQGDAMPERRRLKSQSAALSRTSKELGAQFLDDLADWVRSRAGEAGERSAMLQLNAALAAVTTANGAWAADAPYATYMEALRQCLDEVGRAFRH